MTAAALYCPDLIDRCVAGDARAWDELHRTYEAQALTFLRRLGVGPRDAEDACQEVFVQIFRYLPQFERRADFRTWLYKLCISQAGRVRRRAALIAPWQRLVAWADGSSGEPSGAPWSDERSSRVVERALGELPARHREIFVMYELEGLSTGEIGGILGVPAPTVRRLLQEARASFAAFVRDEPLGRKR